MENKLNHTTIENYSAAYSKKKVATFFDLEETINGKQILNLSNIPQLNLFIIKNLFQKWKKETNKLQSPYFNYDAAEVQQALKNFMNALSQNIAIKRNHFEPLLKKSVQDTILLIFSPYDFYSKEMNHPDRTRLSSNDLHEISKYVKVNRRLLDAIIARFESDEIDEVFNDEAFSILNEIMEEVHAEVEDYSQYLQKFSEVVPLSVDMIYHEVVSESEDEDYRQLKINEIEQTNKASAPPVENTHASKNLNDKFFKEHKTLNDNLNIQSNMSLADIHQKKRIDSIKQHITLNQKFMFINELFAGNKDEFNSALDQLERCASYNEAMRFIKQEYMIKNQWNPEDDEVAEFLEVVAKRYN